MDPTAATAKEMQQLLHIIRRLMERDNVTDEFDKENVTQWYTAPANFGKITRLARLQELLDTLLAGGVGVLAGSYYDHSWADSEDRSPATARIRLRGGVMKAEEVFEIRFAPRDVEELIISPRLDPNFDEIKEELREHLRDEEIPF